MSHINIRYYMPYNDKIIGHVNSPNNLGSLDKQSKEVGTGFVGNAACGDMLQIQIKVQNNIIVDAKAKIFGCGCAIASTSLATEKLKGLTLEQAKSLTEEELAQELGLPPLKLHCSVLAVKGVMRAMENYSDKQAGENADVIHVDISDLSCCAKSQESSSSVCCSTTESNSNTYCQGMRNSDLNSDNTQSHGDNKSSCYQPAQSACCQSVHSTQAQDTCCKSNRNIEPMHSACCRDIKDDNTDTCCKSNSNIEPIHSACCRDIKDDNTDTCCRNKVFQTCKDSTYETARETGTGDYISTSNAEYAHNQDDTMQATDNDTNQAYSDTTSNAKHIDHTDPTTTSHAEHRNNTYGNYVSDTKHIDPADLYHTFDYASQPFTLTSRAFERFWQIISDAETALGVRIFSKEGGCAGNEYDIALQYEDTDEDTFIYKSSINGQICDIIFFVPQSSLMFLTGLEIDYIRTDVSAQFVFKNPSLKMCGCGASFKA